MKQVAEHTSSYSPEVSLAISTAPTTDEELEDFFFEHGFEYVEGHTQTPDESAGLATSAGTPGIHRAIDALSTIMWPSMVRTETTGPKLTSRPEPSIATGEDTDETDIDYETLVNAAGNDGKTNMQREMEMLERWLEEDDENYRQLPEDGHDDTNAQPTGKLDEAWSTADSTSRQGPTDAEGFDDDFTEFQSAPTTSSREIQNTESSLNEDLDSELPSTDDIHAAATRIFGPLPAHAARPDAFAVLSDSATPSEESRPAPPESAGDPHTGTGRSGPELDMDEPAFDLTGILGALDAMKDEISRIPDMRTRRRAAAKAALGFVYGLEETSSPRFLPLGSFLME
ncbi:uncharacterized protein FOMMEDRAFT_143534 [Fomitiporia mediterranea MF3/22]|uniref:uncharacterized protein n=1 Tax=Fomitiporia mediterranea (strain MF3/22) TaxID=694068 RepID=UPI00044085F4|nr:uncharacterized protein FOMMEDRAFT_143534 [Fomitiporia mediterranea MF3/22]EJC98069.1 hypothetical protein FOMMEDRAFT_143534 [Fomitiporia mediterranea MF3/22]